MKVCTVDYIGDIWHLRMCQVWLKAVVKGLLGMWAKCVILWLWAWLFFFITVTGRTAQPTFMFDGWNDALLAQEMSFRSLIDKKFSRGLYPLLKFSMGVLHRKSKKSKNSNNFWTLRDRRTVPTAHHTKLGSRHRMVTSFQVWHAP